MLSNDLGTKKIFARYMERLFSWYPNAFLGTKQDRKRRMRDYFHELRTYDLKVVEEAIDSMPTVYPDKLPTAGQVANAARAILSGIRREQESQSRVASERAEDVSYERQLAQIPATEEAQLEWISRASNRCERLGREWMVESKRAGRRGHERISVAMAKDRIRRMVASAIGDGE